VPEWLRSENPKLYGEPLFAAAVAEPLGLRLLEPPFDWLTTIPEAYRKRDIKFDTLSNARQIREPRFVKPADDKCFPAGVISSGDELPTTDILPGSSPVLIAEPVRWQIEYRFFVLNQKILTHSPYLRDGSIVETPEGEWPIVLSEQVEALEFAGKILEGTEVSLPPAVVVDVGFITDRGWAIVEANAAWGSGMYGCDPAEVLRTIERASIQANDLSHEDKKWIRVIG
jgi:hypothetical protein